YSDMTHRRASVYQQLAGAPNVDPRRWAQPNGAVIHLEEQSAVGARAAIAGLGITDMGKVFGRTVSDFAGEAIALALEDAGLQARDLDGLLINGNQSEEMAPSLQFALGLFDLTLVNTMSAFGSSAATMLQYAALAIESGQANVVACV